MDFEKFKPYMYGITKPYTTVNVGDVKQFKFATGKQQLCRNLTC